MDNKLTLMELGVGPNGTIQLEMQSADPVNTPIKAIRPRQEYHMPDVITVRVASGQIHITIHRFHYTILALFSSHVVCLCHTHGVVLQLSSIICRTMSLSPVGSMEPSVMQL